MATSAFRFLSGDNTHDEMRQLYDRIEAGQTVNLNDYLSQRTLLPLPTEHKRLATRNIKSIARFT